MQVSTYIRKTLYMGFNKEKSRCEKHHKNFGEEKMNKIIFSLLCLLIITMGVACVAASDNTTINHDSLQTIDQQHIPVDSNMTVDSSMTVKNNMTVENNTHNDVSNTTQYRIIHYDKKTGNVTGNDTNVQSTNQTPKLNIKGPKVTKLNIKGPKGPIGPLEPSEHTKLAYRYAKIYKEHPEWNITQRIRCFYVNEVGSNLYKYSFEDTVAIILRAHNIACKHYNGTTNIENNKPLAEWEMYQQVRYYFWHGWV